MDKGIQATEEANQSRNEILAGGTAQPCALKKGRKGRPKKIKPLTPELSKELALTIGHFFPELSAWLGDIGDTRNPDYVSFQLKVLLLLGILMFLTHSGSRNHFNDQVRGAVELARTMAQLLSCDVEEIPHLDTLEKVLRTLNAEQIEELHVKLIRRLIRMKALDDWRVNGKFMLAVDGTGVYSFNERHCEHCIVAQHESGAVTYSHKALVGFIVSQNGFALPVACEFIENQGSVYKKQDCEIKAFHRLEDRIKLFFPQTSFWLLLDALYADQTVMRKCFQNGWNFSISFLDTDMPALWAEAQALLALSPGQASKITLPEQQGLREARWVNELDYEGMKLSVIFQEDKDNLGNTSQRFAHLCARHVESTNVWTFATTARLRWRCENEGFNVLKNGGFALEHVYSRHPKAYKIWFLLMLIAHLFQQLLTRGRLGAVFKATFHTFLNYGKQLLEALKNQPLPLNPQLPGQIRLNAS